MTEHFGSQYGCSERWSSNLYDKGHWIKMVCVFSVFVCFVYQEILSSLLSRGKCGCSQLTPLSTLFTWASEGRSQCGSGRQAGVLSCSTESEHLIQQPWTGESQARDERRGKKKPIVCKQVQSENAWEARERGRGRYHGEQVRVTEKRRNAEYVEAGKASWIYLPPCPVSGHGAQTKNKLGDFQVREDEQNSNWTSLLHLLSYFSALTPLMLLFSVPTAGIYF